ncbi:MAG: hypothetical protein WDA09_02355 [Bacteriovoracaceae bacterium]
MEFKNIRELVQLMNTEQKTEARKNFERFYEKPFGNVEPILCSSTDGEEFLTLVNVNDFE